MLRSRVPINFPWALGTKDSRTARLFDGRRLAMFKDSKGKMTAIDDVCPHRGAKLSSGTTRDGCIECPYHGWKFDGDGRLVSVPTTKKIPKNSDVKKYQLEELYDFVWNVPTESKVSPPIYTLLDDPKWNRVSGSEEVIGNWIDWVANSTDISHINYVHDFGNEKNGTVDEVTVEEYPDRAVCTAYVRPKAATLFTAPIQVKRSLIKVEFVYPNTTIIHIKLKKPYEFVTYTTITPLDRNTSRMTWTFAHTLPKFFNEHFGEQMKKTILEDEDIISEIPDNFPFRVNVPCDKLQMVVMDRLNQMVMDNEENLFTLL
jgi:phenylpropionate dioxygenase-like ring-hydroxylating dioxygenase large terminal subunit